MAEGGRRGSPGKVGSAEHTFTDTPEKKPSNKTRDAMRYQHATGRDAEIAARMAGR